MRSVIAAVAAAVAAATASAPLTEWTRVLLTDGVKYGAMCIDGSPAAVYVKPGIGDDANKWILFWEGGGWCTSPESCYARSKTALGSSTTYAPTTSSWSARDILYPNCTTNPTFCNWSSAYMPYCDGQSRSGNLDAPLVVNNTNLYFRGYRNLEASLYELLSDRPNRTSLTNATHVVVSGSSAGGLTTMLHIDYINQRIREAGNTAADVRAVPEVGFFIDGASIWNGTHIMTEAYQRAVEMANVTGMASQVNSGCLYYYGRHDPANIWKCFMAQYTYPFITTPVFIVNSKYDQWQLENILAPNPDFSFDVGPYAPWLPCINDPLKACNSTQYAQFQGYSTQFMTALNASLAGTPASSLSQNGGIITSCAIHTTLISGLSHRIAVGGKTLYQAVSDWVLQTQGAGGAQYWTYDGAWPNNPTCAGPLDAAAEQF